MRRKPVKNNKNLLALGPPKINIQSQQKRLFLRQKKSTTFFHARISRSGKGRVSDFSATREGGGRGLTPSGRKGHAQGPDRKGQVFL
jgi:hypothetical protein